MSATILATTFASATVKKPRISPSLWIFRTLHLWVGLSFGLLLVAQGLSGAALVWRPELDRLMTPALTHVQPDVQSPPFAHMDAEWHAVQQAVPGASIRGVRLPMTSDGTDEWMVQMPSTTQAASGHARPRWTVYTSPATGQVLGVRGRKRDALQWMIELHHNLLLGPVGRSVQGALAVATVALALSGLWLWWPKHFTWSRFRPRTTVRPLHYALGFWAMWPLLAIATTAMYFTWKQPIQHLFGLPSANRATRRRGRTRPGSTEGVTLSRTMVRPCPWGSLEMGRQAWRVC